MQRFLITVVVTMCILLLWSGSAGAYPWMIRHEYNGCAPCHADPSGGGLLTAYGRAQSELLLDTRWKANQEDQEVRRTAGFAWGAWEPPEWLLLGGYGRTMFLVNRAPGAPTSHRLVRMQYDLAGGVRIGALRAAGTMGYLPQGGQTIAVTTNGNGENLVSREHWVGFALHDDTWLVRAGRINLPFGLRNIEHTAWARTASRTDLNDTQQHGVAVAWTREHTRAEIMAIAGNYQINPDRFRERGYSGYAECVLTPRVAVGVSSLITHAQEDRLLRVKLTRQSHGGFARVAPFRALTILAEADAVVQGASEGTHVGWAGMLQADAEPVQGVHVIHTVESLKTGAEGQPTAWGGWLSVAWFFLPHVDVRFDALGRHYPAARGPGLTTQTYLAQFHAYL